MMLKALIVEQLEKDGTLESLRMQPSNGGDIIVAFADGCDLNLMSGAKSSIKLSFWSFGDGISKSFIVV
jgi:hypothetical protein